MDLASEMLRQMAMNPERNLTIDTLERSRIVTGSFAESVVHIQLVQM